MSLLKSTGIIGGLTLVSRVAGFARDMILARVLGAGLAAGLPLEQALRRAAAAGSLACLKPGAQPAIPHAKEVDEALAKA